MVQAGIVSMPETDNFSTKQIRELLHIHSVTKLVGPSLFQKFSASLAPRNSQRGPSSATKDTLHELFFGLEVVVGALEGEYLPNNNSE
jgi:hypothetical protein